jgi:2-keto-4-pentenoate hydratase
MSALPPIADILSALAHGCFGPLADIRSYNEGFRARLSRAYRWIKSHMVQNTEVVDFKAVADEVIASLMSHRQVPTFSSRPRGLTLGDAYRVTPMLRAAFEARGEKIIGRKIGFTNREMWKVYGVEAPVWGYVTDRTAHDLAHTQVQYVKDFAEPRIEPEIMFGLKSPPMAGMNKVELLDCIEWISLGYEMVQSIYPDWKFSAADTIAANGVHGALLVGNRHSIAPRKLEWQPELARFTVELYCNGILRQRGGGAFVLGSPLLALRHLVELLAKDYDQSSPECRRNHFDRNANSCNAGQRR